MPPTVHSHPPTVRLGERVDGGLAPAILAIVERGIHHRPALAARIRAEIELSTAGEFPPVRIVFGERHVLVEDGPAQSPDIRVDGSLPDLISLMAAPLLGGLQSARGRSALGMVVLRRVRVEGKLGLLARLQALVKV
jgi:hypothetical protein